VAQDGSTNYPITSSSWSQEISLDLDMVSAVCPGCNILLVEATTNSFADLGAAENYAAAHAKYVSNSYGGNEFSGETAYDSAYYHHSGVVITVSAGDSGYGVEYPAASPFVTAVGGTTLTRAASTTRGWAETVWSGTGSGCSAYEGNPGWQVTTNNLCTNRTVADTSADANPNTGVAVYDTVNEPGWLVFGGTSVASPIIASVYALAHDATSAQGLYSATTLNHVTSGTNARRCTTYLCNAGVSLTGGYNGPTGNGTPNGTTGF
jgi:subtilase family serine protease